MKALLTFCNLLVSVIYPSKISRQFPGGPVVRTRCFHCPGARVQSLVRELKSHKLRGAAKKKFVFSMKFCISYYLPPSCTQFRNFILVFEEEEFRL